MDEQIPRRRSVCTLAAWLLSATGAIGVWAWVRAAEAHPHGFLPGLDELIYGTIIVATIGFVAALAAFIRGEKWRWVSAPILVASAGILGWSAFAFLRP